MGPTEIRTHLIAEVLRFVLAASQLPGITRIALIGSLTTRKLDPKDADLLVTVMDDANLAPLAQLGRKLQGRAMALGKGGEVFLVDAQNTYLGRICPWKECAPGIRICPALRSTSILARRSRSDSVKEQLDSCSAIGIVARSTCKSFDTPGYRAGSDCASQEEIMKQLGAYRAGPATCPGHA